MARPQLVSVSSPDVASLQEQLLREKKEDTFTQLEDNKKLELLSKYIVLGSKEKLYNRTV